MCVLLLQGLSLGLGAAGRVGPSRAESEARRKCWHLPLIYLHLSSAAVIAASKSCNMSEQPTARPLSYGAIGLQIPLDHSLMSGR